MRRIHTSIPSGLNRSFALSSIVFVAALLPTVLLSTRSYAVPQEAPRSSASQKSFAMNEEGAAFAHQAKFKEAEEALREAVSLDSKNLSAIFNLASVLIQRGKLEEATRLLKKHAAAAKTDAGLYARLGDAYFSSQKLPEAREAYERALELNPNLPKVPARLGTVLSLSDTVPNHLSQAIAHYLHAVDQEPNNADYLSNLVNLYLVTNAPEKAVSTAKRALQLNPSPELYASLGAAYELQKEWKNSLIAYQRSKDLGNSNDELEEKIEALRKRARK
ncbi:tetratricopeptide repeat protein [bacterium]|nr:tetratricopeptide repeat protein [bacterium]